MDLNESNADRPPLRDPGGSTAPSLRPALPPEPGPRRGAAPGTAAVLSLVFPGLGQMLAGAARRGLLIALPTAVLIVVMGLAIAGGFRNLLASLVQPKILIGLIVLDAVFAIYHLFAIVDAYFVAARLRTRSGPGRRSAAVLVAALVVAIGLHGLVGGLGVQAYQTVSTIFVSPGGGISIPDPGFSPEPSGEPGATFIPTPTAGPSWAADGRLNLLLIGGDSGPGRYLIRTDTLILLSVDVASGRATLFGIPRNLLNVPLAPEDAKAFKDGRFPGFLNALWVYAVGHPRDFPAGTCAPARCDQARGFRAITGAVQQLTGVPLDGAVVINLNGFVDLVDAVGGLWLRTERVYDTAYPLENGRGYVTIDISAGCHHLSGHLALAYARSRHQDSDYGRMARQQQVLLAMLHQLDPLALLPKVPKLLDIARDNLLLTIPTADLGSLASLAATVDPDTVQRISFDPPEYPEYLTTKEIGRIRRAVRTVFPTPLPSPSASTKPAATPKPCGG